MPRRPKKATELPDGAFPPMDDTPIEKSAPEAHKRDDDGPIPFDLNELGDIKAPRGGGKAPADKAEAEKPLTVEEKKKKVEAEKKERSRQAFLKAHPNVAGGVGIIAKGAFATGAIISKEPLWNLTDEETAAIGEAWRPVMEIYGPEWLLKLMPVLGAVVVTGQILAGKSAQISEKKEKEKAEKARAQVDMMKQATQDMNAARAQLEARVNAEQAAKEAGKKLGKKGA